MEIKSVNASFGGWLRSGQPTAARYQVKDFIGRIRQKLLRGQVCETRTVMIWAKHETQDAAGAAMNLVSRIQSDLKAALRFNKAGATLGSLVAYPIRRRLSDRRKVIGLKNGLTIVTPGNVELTSLFDEIWVDRCYAPEPFQLSPGDVVIDIGAHVGVFTLWAAAHYPNRRIISLEPSPKSFEILRQNVLRNRLKGVEVLQSACAGRAGTAVLHSRGAASMNTLYTRDVLHSSFRALDSVPVVTLDEIFERFQIKSTGLLKLDCEGAEYEILLNASDVTLRGIRCIALEYHLGLNDQTPQQLAEFLTGKGFEVTILPPCSTEGGYMYAMRR
jgi:FkbM family methyltransferase